MNYLSQFKLEKKRILVLGGNGLIGSELVAALNQTKSKILVLDLKKNNLKKNIKFNYFDLSDKNYLKKFNFILKKFNPNIFINCSYPYNDQWNKNNFSEVDLYNLRENIELNLISYSMLANESAKFFKSKKITGNIIQFGSIYGSVGQDLSIYKNTKMRESMTYSIIKGGLHNLTRQMASYYGKNNIRVNTIAPGGIEGHIAGSKDKQNSQFKKNYSSKTPLGRLAKPEDIPGLVIFLCSNLSSYLTGSIIFVDGGWTAI